MESNILFRLVELEDFARGIAEGMRLNLFMLFHMNELLQRNLNLSMILLNPNKQLADLHSLVSAQQPLRSTIMLIHQIGKSRAT